MTPSERREDKIRGDIVAGWLGLFCSFALVAGVLALIGQGVAWLKTGEWPSLPILSVLQWIGVDATAALGSSWSGFNRILWWLLSQHIFFGLLAIAAFVGWAFGEGAYVYSRFKRRSAA